MKSSGAMPLPPRWLRHSADAKAVVGFATAILDFVATHNSFGAHPSRWTSAGKPRPAPETRIPATITMNDGSAGYTLKTNGALQVAVGWTKCLGPLEFRIAQELELLAGASPEPSMTVG